MRYNVAPDQIAAAQNAFLPAIKGALAGSQINGTVTLSGYEGSELFGRPIVDRKRR